MTRLCGHILSAPHSATTIAAHRAVAVVLPDCATNRSLQRLQSHAGESLAKGNTSSCTSCWRTPSSLHTCVESHRMSSNSQPMPSHGTGMQCAQCIAWGNGRHLMHYLQGIASSDPKMLTQAKELFAQREEFQLHILLAHPPQLAQENGAGPTGNRAVLFDGEFQDATEIAANFSRCRLRGKPSHQRWLHDMHGSESVASHPSKIGILCASKCDKVCIAGNLSHWSV